MPTEKEIAEAMMAGLSVEDALAGVKPTPVNTAPKSAPELTVLLADANSAFESQSRVLDQIDKVLKLAEAEASTLANSMTTLAPDQREAQRRALFEAKRKEILGNQDKSESDNWKHLRAPTEIEKRAEATAKFYPSPSGMLAATLWNDPDGAAKHLAILKGADIPTLRLARLRAQASPTKNRLFAAALHNVVAAMPTDRQRLLGFTAQELAEEIAGAEHKKIVDDVARIKHRARDALNRWRSLKPSIQASTKALDKIKAGVANRRDGLDD